MKHSFKKLISLVLVLAISFAMAVPAFASSVNSTPNPTMKMLSAKMAASGKTYGPWFGDNSESFSTEGNYEVAVTVLKALTDGIVSYVDDVKAKAIAAVLSGSLSLVKLSTDEYTYGTVNKRYREVYISGEFAYYENQITVTAYVYRNGSSKYLGKTTKTYNGSVLMVTKP